MNPIIKRHLALFMFLLWPLTAQSLHGQGSGELTVTVSAGLPSPNPVAVNEEITALLTAEASNVPTGSYGCEVGPPLWYYNAWTVEYAADPAGPWGEPPAEADYCVSVDPPPATNPGVTVLRAWFSTGGYWRITDLEAEVSYADTCQNYWFGYGTAGDIEVTVIGVEFSPASAFMNVGGSGGMTATVTPAAEAGNVTFSIADDSIATLMATPPDLSFTGVAPGTTQVQAKMGTTVLAEANVHVVEMTYSPDSGPILTQVVFSGGSAGANLFSENTKVDVTGIFEPEGYTGEPFAISHEGINVFFDPANPNQVAIAVGDLLPAEFASSSNPGIAMEITGTISAVVTLTDGDNSSTVEGVFQITPAFALGQLKDGYVDDLSVLDVWRADTADDLPDQDPSAFVYGQITLPINDFTGSSPQPTVTAQVQTFQSDGTPLNSGVSLVFSLAEITSSSYIYQSGPLFLMENPALEGDQGDFTAIYSTDGYVQIVKMLP
jgi:hypothetical protein